jgi:hypothetical protein
MIMEQEISIKLTIVNDGTNWFLAANGRALLPKFKSREAAEVYLRCLKKSMPGIAEVVSAELEK